MTTVKLHSCTLIAMYLVERVVRLVTKQLHDYMLQQYDDSCIVYIRNESNATEHDGGEHVANTHPLHASPAAAAASIHRLPTAAQVKQRHMSGSASNICLGQHRNRSFTVTS